MPSRSETVPRCLLCSMHCPIGAGRDELGHIGTVYPPDLGADQGACVRALTAARLLDLRERAFDPRMNGEVAPVADVLGGTAEALAEAEGHRIGILVDVNRPLEGVLAVAGLSRQLGARLAAFVPPDDLPMLRAGLLPPSKARSFEQVAECDLILAVGDPFSTHPAVAGFVRDMQFAERSHRLLNVDVAEGRSARGADEATIVSPAKVAAFLAALAIECGAQSVKDRLDGRDAREVCEACELPFDQVQSLVSALGEAEAPGIIVSITSGRFAFPSAAATATGALASALDCAFWPLPVATNSAAVPALEAEYGAIGVGELIEAALEDELDVVLVLGPDPALALPKRAWDTLIHNSHAICWAGCLQSAFAEGVDLLLPLALPWEEEGTVLGADGTARHFPAWEAKQPTVMSLAELAQNLAGAVGVQALEAGSARELAGRQAPGPAEDALGPWVLDGEEAGANEALVFSVPEPHGYTGGLSLGDSSWQVRLATEEAALLSPRVVEENDLREAGLVTLRGRGEFIVPYRTNGAGGRVVGLPAHWRVLRELIGWEGKDDAIEPSPAVVEIEKSE